MWNGGIVRKTWSHNNSMKQDAKIKHINKIKTKTLLKECNYIGYSILYYYFYYLFEDVFPPIRDAIDVIGHVKSWGKTFVVSQVNSTHKIIIKIYFYVS